MTIRKSQTKHWVQNSLNARKRPSIILHNEFQSIDKSIITVIQYSGAPNSNLSMSFRNFNDKKRWFYKWITLLLSSLRRKNQVSKLKALYFKDPNQEFFTFIFFYQYCFVYLLWNCKLYKILINMLQITLWSFLRSIYYLLRLLVAEVVCGSLV